MLSQTLEPPPTRQVTCARCGAVFGCCLGGGCWCAVEPYRLPLPADAAADCLCPDCLLALAATGPSHIAPTGP